MFESIAASFSSEGFMPHIHCYLGNPALVSTMFITDMLIGIAYVGISITLWGLVRKIKIPFSFVVLCFGVFIGACGTTHFMEVYTLWHPDYWLAAWIKIVTAIASVGTGIYLYQLRGPLIQVAEAAKLSEQRRLDLEVLTDSLEHRVKERTSELNRALQTRDDFLSVASHEFRTPITALKLKIELHRRNLAKEGIAVDERFNKFTAEVDSQVGRLSKLVEDLLDLSRVRSGSLSLNPIRFDFSAMLNEVLGRFSSELQANKVQLTSAIEPGLELFGDSLRIEQVMMNLVSNAMKYAPGCALQVTAKRIDGKIEVVFHDQGAGISLQDSEKIFNRFERLEPKSHVQGMGVGLFISQAIIEAHHGKIEVDSSAKGARFVITLPRADEPNQLDSVIPVSDNS